nr:MAG TPA: hypothetical protein [Caudoviricetes sp.]
MIRPANSERLAAVPWACVAASSRKPPALL